MENYQIKNGYKCNLDQNGKPIPYNQDEQSSASHQIDIYRFAAKVVRSANLKSCLDVGCGHGFKLVNYIYPICRDITGIDREHSINYCKKEYNLGNWIVDNIENSLLKLENKFDLIITADVIEHLLNPDNLINYVKKFAHDSTNFIFSTPERDLVRGKSDFGPPENISHVREWNQMEFRLYLESRNFEVTSQLLVKDKKRTLREHWRRLKAGKIFEPIKTCQVCLCRLK